MRYRPALIGNALKQRQFERMVERAVASLGGELRDQLQNLEIVVENEPRARESESGDQLFGLYEGVPLTERTSGYGMTLPDKITIYRGPLERHCETREELYEQIRVTVFHEIAHHFGIDEERLIELGYE